MKEGHSMKYCVHCGAQIHDEAVICVKCGCSVEQPASAVANQVSEDDTMDAVIKVFLIFGCIAWGWLLLPLAWCLPITISIFNRLRDKKPIGTGLKVCTLLFVSTVAGICMLCRNENA